MHESIRTYKLIDLKNWRYVCLVLTLGDNFEGKLDGFNGTYFDQVIESPDIRFGNPSLVPRFFMSLMKIRRSSGYLARFSKVAWYMFFFMYDIHFSDPCSGRISGMSYRICTIGRKNSTVLVTSPERDKDTCKKA